MGVFLTKVVTRIQGFRGYFVMNSDIEYKCKLEIISAFSTILTSSKFIQYLFNNAELSVMKA
jgi:hypothetical protein